MMDIKETKRIAYNAILFVFPEYATPCGTAVTTLIRTKSGL
jgi:hypothetical protein